MISEVKSFLGEVEKSDSFKEWKKEHKEGYLCSVFFDDKLQIDFYDPKKDRIASFRKDDEIKFQEDEVFKRKEDKVDELNLEEVKIDGDGVFEIVDREFMKVHTEIQKKIVLLQSNEDPYWNITYLTTNLKLFNIKINAVDGRILEKVTESIMDFRANRS